jgi:hypothetical protein
MEGYAQVIGSLMILFVIVIISHRRLKRKPGTRTENQPPAPPEQADQKSE